jgi:hypothetical protein
MKHLTLEKQEFLVQCDMAKGEVDFTNAKYRPTCIDRDEYVPQSLSVRLGGRQIPIV